ncbi:uncharacterized protein [Bemisia tabaci]|uniref:uncharacterized protein isoform X1 n=1 Tax=Bemisia tabaci TaxID=7038 RepID=UPI003B27B570
MEKKGERVFHVTRETLFEKWKECSKGQKLNGLISHVFSSNTDRVTSEAEENQMGKENLNSQINWEALLASGVPISFDFNVMDHVPDGNYTCVLVETSDSSSVQNFPQDPP